MNLTEIQIQAIIDDTTNKLQAIIEDPCNGDYSDLEMYEDEHGYYPFGSKSGDYDIEEICYDGLPGINSDYADIYITAKCSLNYSYHDDYDPGDYWTPPSGGIEIDNVEADLLDMDFEINILNPDIDDYESIEVSNELKQRIITIVNERIKNAC